MFSTQLSKHCCQIARHFSHETQSKSVLINKALEKASTFVWVEQNVENFLPALLNKRYICQLNFHHNSKNYLIEIETITNQKFKKSFDSAHMRQQWLFKNFGI